MNALNQVTIEQMATRWTNPISRPLFKGKLIDETGCKCSQGDVLSCAGYSDEQLRSMEQSKADIETACILGISITHSVLLRQVNDTIGGAPQLVLTNPEKILGPKAPILLAFWFHLDNMDEAAWAATGAAAAGAAAAGAAAWAAARASNEIQGMDILDAGNKQPYFLSFFGLDTWDKVRALVNKEVSL